MNEKQTQSHVVIVTIAVFIATFMTAIEGTIVSTAMPTIIGSLHGVSLMNWVFSIYLLMTAVSTPIYGKLSDVVGRKPVFLFGLGLFVVGSVLCSMSNSMLTLILARVVQGLGSGAIQPLTFTIIADIYPLEKRAKILGLNGSAWGIAAVIAPLLGGFIVEQLSWHWVFLINLPVGIITMLLIWIFFKEKREQGHKVKIDYVGTMLLILVLLPIMLALQYIGTGSPLLPIGLVAVSVISIFIFIHFERKVSDPILPLHLFSNKTFVIQNVIALLVSGFLIGFEAYIPTWMQGILGLSPSMGGFAVTPSSIVWIFGSFWAGSLLKKFAPNRVIYISLIFLATANVFLLLAHVGTPFWYFLMLAAIAGCGFGLTITTTTVTAQTVVPSENVGVATSFNTLLRTIGMSLMVSVDGIILNTALANGAAQNKKITVDMMNKLIDPQTASQLPTELLPKMREILFSGLHNIYVAGAVLLVIALLLNAFEIKNKDILGSK
ncbi:MDR family MFS transporter [Companilactobacillus sp.]|jgi:EmrB/QacA subfamily drug resistance transporter|uniref:MDR family MFS transporter n=1 Tax=Companilactobacillus sp. TaxID=2767905 RepID=UPI0025C3B7DB|nr:MDR family MFS transporter [Companilactobacillus sp.]MCH4007910.1 MFS transporter [Companilactobacillus sp.]MCH4051911.1 MFS transporter [Companilactobacillus sp.]MCH4075853.1 MFS transporter [Companilactobacillus sp.]MCH4124428.1 MFS transporter [Companilactobacillus sp.]MCH4132609.1 MFS transporter [Companilactobacillus sp.]